MFCLIAHSRMMDISNTICAYIHAVFLNNNNDNNIFMFISFRSESS